MCASVEWMGWAYHVEERIRQRGCSLVHNKHFSKGHLVGSLEFFLDVGCCGWSLGWGWVCGAGVAGGVVEGDIVWEEESAGVSENVADIGVDTTVVVDEDDDTIEGELASVVELVSLSFA